MQLESAQSQLAPYHCLQSGLINSFPFDPAGLNSPDMAVREIKNGRLAMVSERVGSSLCHQAGITHVVASPG